MSILLVHDLLLAKKGIALPANHGLRSSVERHKARLQAEFTKARIRRKLSSVEALKALIESGLENDSNSTEAPHPRWIRINTLKTTLEEQLDSTFAGYERTSIVYDVRQRGSKRIFIDGNIPNLVAVTASTDLPKTDAYKSGEIIFQDKASCFPAYLLDSLHEDGDIIDACAAPGNKTTHLAAILLAHSPKPGECSQKIHAFEKDKGRAETLEKMVNQAGSHTWIKLHPGQDFLKSDPEASAFKNVGALLLDPSCSGSGIIGRDEMPGLHLPILKDTSNKGIKFQKTGKKMPGTTSKTRKRKRNDHHEELDVMVDDDGKVTTVNSEDELKIRLEALAKFQLELLLHAFKFPAARKITYSTCSIHAEENEMVVQKALEHTLAKGKGWRILKRDEQIRGMREWPVRGSLEACGQNDELAEACIRANKGDEHGTMGFFLAGFTREVKRRDLDGEFLRDERGHLVRDLMGFPMRVQPNDSTKSDIDGDNGGGNILDDAFMDEVGEEEWAGFDDEESKADFTDAGMTPIAQSDNGPKPAKDKTSKKGNGGVQKRPSLSIKQNKKQKKGR